MKNGSDGDAFLFLPREENPPCAVIEVPEAAWQTPAALDGKGQAVREIRVERPPLLRLHFRSPPDGRVLATSTASLRFASADMGRLQIPETIAQLALWIASLTAIGIFLREIF